MTKQVDVDKVVRARLAAQKARFEQERAELVKERDAALARAKEIETQAKGWEEAARRLPEVEAEATWARFGVEDAAVRRRLMALHRAEQDGAEKPVALGEWLTAAKDDPQLGGWLTGGGGGGSAPPASASPGGSAGRQAPPSTTAGARPPPNQAAPNVAQLRESHRALLAAGKKDEAKAVLAQIMAAAR